jgi:hypothetical protein
VNGGAAGTARRLSKAALVALVGLIATRADASAQLDLSGQADVVVKHGTDRYEVNSGLRGNTPFAPVRVRLLASRWFNERIAFFGELLFDTEADPQIFGAYMVVNEIGGRPWLNARVGLAPSPLGSFPLRGTYFNANPVIGEPLVWQYRTTLDRGGAADAAGLIERRRSNDQGLPALYESCWNVQAELLGELGIFEYSVGVTPAAVSNPGARRDDGVQLLGRLGAEPVPGLRLGLSGAYGPYIERQGDDRFDEPFDPNDYDQSVVGYDLELSRGRVRIFSEAYVSAWEAPLVADELRVLGAYGEARYAFLPGWYAAARIDRMDFNDIAPATGAPRTGWDDDVLRFEAAIGWRLAREVLVKLDWQRTTYTTGIDPDLDLFAIQLSAVF